MSEEQAPNRPLTKKNALLEKKRAIEAQLRELAVKESTTRRKAETKAKIIIGGLVLANRRDLITELANKASPRDLEHLKEVGLL